MLIILTSTANSWGQFLMVILLLVFVVFLAYASTRIVGMFNKRQELQSNIKVIETFRITSNKYLQIVKVADKCMVIGVSKDSIVHLTDLSKEDIENLKDVSANNQILDFRQIFEKCKKTSKINEDN